MIKAIFFDNGGVLGQEGYALGAEKYEEEFNIPAGEFYKIIHDFKGWKDFTLGQITEAEYLEMCRQRSKDYPFNAERFIEIMDESTKPNRELINYIKELANRYLIGVISNNSKEWFERSMKKIGLDGIIKLKAVSGYVHIRKPAREIFQLALDMAGVAAQESVYVDDRPERTDGARDLGMNIIVFQNDVQKFKKDLAEILNRPVA